MNCIYQRRSIRSYNEKEIEIQVIKDIIKAGMNAPSAMNMKPCSFLVISNKLLLSNMSNMGSNAFMLDKCNKAIVVLVKRNNQFWQQDAAASTQNILLEATNYNVGSCWIGIAPNEEFQKYIGDILNINDYQEIFSIISLGYTDKSKELNNIFDESKIRFID